MPDNRFTPEDYDDGHDEYWNAEDAEEDEYYFLDFDDELWDDDFWLEDDDFDELDFDD